MTESQWPSYLLNAYCKYGNDTKTVCFESETIHGPWSKTVCTYIFIFASSKWQISVKAAVTRKTHCSRVKHHIIHSAVYKCSEMNDDAIY